MTRKTNRRHVVSWGLGIVAVGTIAASTGCQADKGPEAMAYSSAEQMVEFEKGANRPPTASTLYRLARILAAQEKTAEAEGVLRTAISRYPDHLPSYVELAGIHVRRGKVEQAIEVLNMGLERVPDHPILLNDLGMCHMLRGEYEEAVSRFQAAAEADPENVRYLSNVALATGMMGDYEGALREYMVIARIFPKNAMAALHIADNLADLDRPSEAVQWF